MDLLNPRLNLQYLGYVYMGSKAQPLKVVFDTGSDWLVLEDLDCRTCYSTRYNTSASTTYEVASTAT